MASNAWAIKLGSGGRCVPFCERHGIVGIGWQGVSPDVVAKANRDDLWLHIKSIYPAETDRWIGSSTGQLFRFGQQCVEGDYVLYYDPPHKRVRICRVTSGPLYRDFELKDDTDVWHCRRVEYPTEPISILDLYGSLKGKLLGPRMSFWALGDCFDTIDAIVQGKKPNVLAAPDFQLQTTYGELRDLVVCRLEALNDRDWELLVVDYLKEQGAQVDESQAGGSRPIIDAEARFDHGEFGEQTWRVQVKRYQGQAVDWPQIEADLKLVGDAKFCFVSVFGFTPLAEQKAEDEGVRLMAARDFTLFVLGGKIRESLRLKLALPTVG